MSATPSEFDELRVSIERLRAMLEGLVVRGLRACGPEQLGQLQSYREQLEHAGAGHVAAGLAELQEKIEKDDRTAARSLLRAQTAVRLLERLLTLRVVTGRYQMAAALMEQGAAGGEPDAGDDESDEEEDDA